MNKYLVIADNHFSVKSSVIQKQGDKFSTRLENQKQSLEWVNSFGLPVVHLGDYFDKDVMCAEEASCYKEILQTVDMRNWIFLEGNHGYNGGFSMSDLLPGQVIKKPMNGNIGGRLVQWMPFNSTVEALPKKCDVMFGHLGVENIPFGAKGFPVNRLVECCSLFLNGHLHNGVDFAPHCHNIGSLTAQNFSDECTNREKGAVILDFDTLEIEFVRNPHAFNFYKMTQEQAMTYKFPNIRNACISVTCEEAFEEAVRKKLSEAYYLRVNVIKSKVAREKTEERIKEFSVDYLEKFRQSYIEKQGESAVILDELAEVCR